MRLRIRAFVSCHLAIGNSPLDVVHHLTHNRLMSDKLVFDGKDATEEKMNVLAIGAHPDDLELQCGGTLALYAQQGHNVYVAIATDGGIGHPSALNRHEVAEIRHQEALNSAKRMGAEVIWMG